MIRKRYLLFLSLVFLSLSLQAQPPGVSNIIKALPKVTLGVKLGVNFDQLHTSNVNAINQSYNPGFVTGLFLSIRKHRFGGRVEGLVNTVTYTYTYNALQNGTYKNLYLSVPLLFEYRIWSWLWAQGGPQYSEVLSVSAKPNLNPSTDPKSHFKPEFAGVIGLEAKLPVHLTLGARYVLGVTNINNESASTVSGSWQNRTAQIYLGFRFFN